MFHSSRVGLVADVSTLRSTAQLSIWRRKVKSGCCGGEPTSCRPRASSAITHPTPLDQSTAGFASTPHTRRDMLADTQDGNGRPHTLADTQDDNGRHQCGRVGELLHQICARAAARASLGWGSFRAVAHGAQLSCKKVKVTDATLRKRGVRAVVRSRALSTTSGDAKVTCSISCSAGAMGAAPGKRGSGRAPLRADEHWQGSGAQGRRARPRGLPTPPAMHRPRPRA